jgi:hypothetical protein
MGNLRGSASNAADQRPFQDGSVQGTKNTLPVTAAKEWLIDTGARISTITKANADQFDLMPLGGSASGTTGGGGILIKSGLTMIFTVRDAQGVNRLVHCSLPVGVKPNNAGSEILGMDQLAHVRARVSWDPFARNGDLYL